MYDALVSLFLTFFPLCLLTSPPPCLLLSSSLLRDPPLHLHIPYSAFRASSGSPCWQYHCYRNVGEKIGTYWLQNVMEEKAVVRDTEREGMCLWHAVCDCNVSFYRHFFFFFFWTCCLCRIPSSLCRIPNSAAKMTHKTRQQHRHQPVTTNYCYVAHAHARQTHSWQVDTEDQPGLN